MLKGLIGIPFVDRGRDLSGMDCWGLAMATMKRYGHDVPDFDVSCFDTLGINTIYDMQRWSWRAVEIPDPGDLAVMTLDAMSPTMIQHVGVYIGNGRVLQTLKKRHSHLVRIDDPYWSRKIRGWYRWVG